ncbi:uncharacterized protein EURHEDRAFT_387215 [Aspergillus ruber CBS 135680]|uniref:DUF7587 domain-containing protein n=1 Tax=Aspergillus ruber (strain CBS 135680) TaxID=1388766 RepID=A0A017SB06_ASPRC|nr:uncharacterized protein EURHEDRAFT_387215 [Aspergillus ruber CBS 135680]EYE94218.1 hypothetical protein EURHEDRAFT_387215 [Aspergillus ruber CBS 135680]
MNNPTQNQPYPPISRDQVPWLLFRVEHRLSSSYGTLSAQARITRTVNPPTPDDFDRHLLNSKDFLTPFLSYFSNFRRALSLYRAFRLEGRQEVTITALWARDMANIYNAESIAQSLGFRDGDGANPRRMLRDHIGEFLIHGGIVDTCRILTIFRGMNATQTSTLMTPSPGPITIREVDVVFQCDAYQAVATLPEGFLPSSLQDNALRALDEEIYRRTGVLNDFWRDMIVSAVMGRPVNWTGRFMGFEQMGFLFGDTGQRVGQSPLGMNEGQ